MKILVIGATGMVGHILFYEFRKKNINVIGIGRRKTEENIINLDLFTDWYQIRCFLQCERFDIVVNCSAILVNESNINRLQAVYINSLFPHLLADLLINSDTKVIHLSTGGVFSGNEEFYLEDSPLLPQTYYGITKAAGEFNNGKDLIIRSDFWGPDTKKNGTGLFNWFLNQEGPVTAYTNVFFNGISNIELARIILELINYTGIVHIGTTEKISKCDFLDKIKNIFNLKNITFINNENDYKNIFLKSCQILPDINDFDTMIKEIYQYLIYNKENYAAIYPQVYGN